MQQNSQKYIKDEMSKKIVRTVKNLALKKGASQVTVRDVLNELKISNRVFYNRFYNIEEVLQLVYLEIAESIHKEMNFEAETTDDFFDSLISFMETTLINSYNQKGNLNQFIFEQDSISRENYNWWIKEIKRIINYAIDKGFVRDLDIDKLSYSIWCFIRGFNADAISREIPLEDSLNAFRYSFKLFLNGLRPN